jgi:type VI protein secretion system component VasK
MTGSVWNVAMLGALADYPLRGQPLSKVTGLIASDVLWILVAVLTLLLVLVLWAKYLRNRKPRKRRSGGQKVFRESGSSDEDQETEEEAADARRRYKYRYKRRQHRVRNPTLSETGGLPPTRSEEPPQASSP